MSRLITRKGLRKIKWEIRKGKIGVQKQRGKVAKKKKNVEIAYS